jgi:hypothetical protein
MTLEVLADAIEMSHQNLGKIERGLVPLGGEHHAPLARALAVDVSDLFRDPKQPAYGDTYVPVLGYVGADSEGTIVYTTCQGGGDLVPMPPGGGELSRGLEVRGHSGGDFAPEGSIIYFEDQRNPVTPDMLGHPCVIETDDERVLLKRVLRGSHKGVYDLESISGPTLRDVKIRWAALVTYVVQPHQARKIKRHVQESQVA